jgi:calcineurin-like phosphoesterase family protein
MISASKNYFVISDTHWQHENILKFTKEDGTLVRPEFSSIQEMDEIMIQNWNAEVKNQDDIVYHLGDVTFGSYEKFCTSIAPRLNGKKRLIIGNHDRIKGTKLMDFFEKVALWMSLDQFGVIMTHIPIEQRFFRGKCTHNAHGHLHEKSLKSPIHANVCVEKTGYKPVNLEEISLYFGN